MTARRITLVFGMIITVFFCVFQLLYAEDVSHPVNVFFQLKDVNGQAIPNSTVSVIGYGQKSIDGDCPGVDPIDCGCSESTEEGIT